RHRRVWYLGLKTDLAGALTRGICVWPCKTLRQEVTNRPQVVISSAQRAILHFQLRNKKDFSL
ncbi:MAG: hypothetical protein ACTHLX_05695, partial [Candidatus Binatia bacterium]